VNCGWQKLGRVRGGKPLPFFRDRNRNYIELFSIDGFDDCSRRPDRNFVFT